MIRYYHDFKKEVNSSMQYETVKEVLDNAEAIASTLPQEKITFSPGPNIRGNSKKMLSRDCIFFDIDNMDTNRIDDYIQPIAEGIGVDKDSLAFIASGNGLHVIVQFQEEWTDPDFYINKKEIYARICRRIGKELGKEGLIGQADPQPFQQHSTIRMPFTMNVKPKGSRPVKLILNNLKPSVKAIDDLAPDIIENNPKDSASDTAFQAVGYSVDTKGIQEKCGFLKHCKEKPNDVTEPQWYASLTLLARAHADNGIARGLCHDYSKGHKGYDPLETDAKIEQALEARGPRTCANIRTLFDGCKKCPHKVATPLQLQGEDFIRTEATGFRKIGYDKSGKPKKGKVDQEDLLKAFIRDHNFVLKSNARFKGGDIIYVWNGDHYDSSRSIQEATLSYAEEKVDEPTIAICKEFQEKIKRTQKRCRNEEWFDSGRGKLNLKNGIFDLETFTFSEKRDENIFFDYVLDYEYDPKAEAPVFMDKLYKDMKDKDEETTQEKMEYFLQYFAFCLSPVDISKNEIALILTGEGSNGKSSMINVLQSMLHENQRTSLTMTDLANSKRTEPLENALINFSKEEGNKSVIKNTALFKSAISGEEISCEPKYKSHYTFKNKAKFIFACNSIPKAEDGYSLERRLAIINFGNAYFDERDNPSYEQREKYMHFFEKKRSVGEKLMAERSGILNIVMDAYKRLKANDFLLPELKSSVENVKKYVADNDRFKFIYEYLEDEDFIDMTGDKDDFVASALLWEDFKRHNKNKIDKFDLVKNIFIRKVKQHPKIKEMNLSKDVKKGNARGLLGLKIQNDEFC